VSLSDRWSRHRDFTLSSTLPSGSFNCFNPSSFGSRKIELIARVKLLEL